ncbi:PilT protein domain-containing protein [Natrinema gari JCM 14663]|uniref:PilT protein domain-containing protein n=1 Tax=Natrinema gari JCM 14663 TaxID=1230459 RepID=L9YPR9_9EURY|nr:PilT protein domain-containing protein [Natrinema gari JCM 14663]
MAVRDLMSAATARLTGDQFVVADSAFQTEALEDSGKYRVLRCPFFRFGGG